jgi:hypothetical protein
MALLIINFRGIHPPSASKNSVGVGSEQLLLRGHFSSGSSKRGQQAGKLESRCLREREQWTETYVGFSFQSIISNLILFKWNSSLNLNYAAKLSVLSSE